jgi:hypothetical protein
MLSTRFATVIAVALATVMLVFSGLAVAQTPSDDAYSGLAAEQQAAAVADDNDDDSVGAVADDGGSLPFTGFEIGIALLAGTALIGTGVLIRRASRGDTA